MEGLDDVAVSTLRAANISEAMLCSLTRDDLRDIFPGPEHFLRRKRIWLTFHGDQESGRDDSGSSTSMSPMPQTSTPDRNYPTPKYKSPPSANYKSPLPQTSTSDKDSPSANYKSPLPQTSTSDKDSPSANYKSPQTPHYKSPLPQTSTAGRDDMDEKVVRVSVPDYVVHTDTELELVRNEYFELAKKGEEQNCQMSKELRCRLVRNTMISMIAILRAKGGAENERYPSRLELRTMAKRIIKYYPMLQDLKNKNPWATVFKQLNKRLQNVRTPQKRPEGIPRPSKKRRLQPRVLNLELPTTELDEIDSTDQTSSLSQSSEGNPSTADTPADDDSPESDMDSRATMAKHYKTLQALYRKKNPNHESVSQLLDLEFQARRAFIDSDSIPEEYRYAKVIEAYPCFQDIGHVMGELRRILDKNNPNFIDELKERWNGFCEKLKFYGVAKKKMKNPIGKSTIEQALMILDTLPSLFPSAAAPPKKLRNASEALVYVLEENEDPNMYLKKRPLSCPVLIVSESNCLLAIGEEPVHILPKCEVSEGVLYLMAHYYTLHLTYPRCVSTLLSVIQTEVLLDKIHERDLTPSYKKAMADWKTFIGS